MTKPEAENPENLTLEAQVLDIFTETRETLRQGKEFASHKDNPHAENLKIAVGQLPVSALAELIAGQPLGRGTPEGTEEFASVHSTIRLWSSNAEARQLRLLAYSAYCENRDAEVAELLQGKRITATTRQNAGGLMSAICQSNGIMEQSGGTPETVSGTFYWVDTNTGNLVLSADEPTEEVKFWRISLISGLTGEQIADLEIEPAREA